MRLIDADALKKQCYPFPCAIGVENAVTIRAINEAPTIDAVPVVRGEWTINSDYPDTVICSLCGYKEDMWWADNGTNYCPNCGAKMEEVDDC